MASRNSSPPMPADVATRLRVNFNRLPPRAARFRTPEGAKFLRELKQACEEYGAIQVARAIGLSPSNVYVMRYREQPRRVYPYPSDVQMREVRLAWAAVQRLKAQRRQVRRTTVEFQKMQAALRTLRRRTGTDDVMIAVALEVEPSQLRAYEDVPPTPGASERPRS